MAHIPFTSEAAATGELAEVYRMLGTHGPVANILTVHGSSPAALKAHLGLYKTLMLDPSPLSRAQREIIPWGSVPRQASIDPGQVYRVKPPDILVLWDLTLYVCPWSILWKKRRKEMKEQNDLGLTMKRGEVARQAGVNIETLRFYERQGVLPAPPRLESGYRAYPPETVEVVMFIKRAQELGFTLAEIQELLSLSRATEEQCATVRSLAQRRLSQIRKKMADLKAMESALATLLRACADSGKTLTCPILESLFRGHKRRS